MRSGAQGATVLSFHLDESGKIASGKVLRSSGPTREHRMLDAAALNALMACAIEAEVEESGQPVSRDVVVVYTWLLQ
jgi:protein TonB